MYINDISAVSEVMMDYTLDFYIRQLWTDERLTYNSTTVSQLILGAEFAKKIWIPDTFFINGKQVSLHISTTTDSNVLLRIQPNGHILYSLRLTVVLSCPMDLRNFPMDRQLCQIKVASYGYSTSDIDYHWAQGFDTFGIRDGLYLPTFVIQGYRRFKTFKLLSTGNYTRLICELRFARSIGYYLNQIYIPAFLIVVISWMPFWLDREDTHARVGLGVTTVLTMTTLITSTNEALPKISYIKAIDIYLFTCFLMVFGSLIEYATVGYFESSVKGLDKYLNNVINTSKATGDEKSATNPETEANGVVVKPMRTGMFFEVVSRKSASTTDKYSRCVFPVVFVVFNVMYWVIYLNLSRETITDLVLAKDY
ncbi:unnamed protein product, partial [Oppiella nova]